MLEALAGRKPFGERAALVVAHPDDETIAAGGSLHLLPGLLLVHVTDGAPRRLGDAGREGFDTPEAYAAAREAELGAALELAGIVPSSWPGLIQPSTGSLFPRPSCGKNPAEAGVFRVEGSYVSDAVDGRVKPGHDGVPTGAHEASRAVGARRIRLGFPDQDAVLHLRPLTETLAMLFRDHGITAVLTHAYEGGHPDHDATAFAVHRAAGGIPVFEFAGYHAAPGQTVVQSFLPGPAEVRVVLPPPDAARKRAMLDCFRTQAEILSRFDPATERFRPAPAYDFTAPPHPGPLNYETWGWELTGARWRDHARGEMPCAA